MSHINPNQGAKGRFVLGIDCEMVYAKERVLAMFKLVGPPVTVHHVQTKDDKDALARVSVVSCSGVIYDVSSLGDIYEPTCQFARNEP